MPMPENQTIIYRDSYRLTNLFANIFMRSMVKYSLHTHECGYGYELILPKCNTQVSLHDLTPLCSCTIRTHNFICSNYD